jgi:hypothetical protein
MLTATDATETLSVAVPETVTEPLRVEPPAGLEIDIAGAVVSVVTHVFVRLQLPPLPPAAALPALSNETAAVRAIPMMVARRARENRALSIALSPDDEAISRIEPSGGEVQGLVTRAGCSR